MKYTISDLMDHIEDDSVLLEPRNIVAVEQVKTLTMKKIFRTAPHKRKFRPMLRFILAAAVIVLLAGSALAIKSEQSPGSFVIIQAASLTKPDGTWKYCDPNKIAALGLQMIETDTGPNYSGTRWAVPEGEIFFQQYYHTLLTDVARDPEWYSYDYADMETGRLVDGKLIGCTDYYREGAEEVVLVGRLWRWLNHGTATLLSADAGVSTETLEIFLRNLTLVRDGDVLRYEVKPQSELPDH